MSIAQGRLHAPRRRRAASTPQARKPAERQEKIGLYVWSCGKARRKSCAVLCRSMTSSPRTRMEKTAALARHAALFVRPVGGVGVCRVWLAERAASGARRSRQSWKGSRISAGSRSREARSSVLQESYPFHDFGEGAAALRAIAGPRIWTSASSRAAGSPHRREDTHPRLVVQPPHPASPSRSSRSSSRSARRSSTSPGIASSAAVASARVRLSIAAWIVASSTPGRCGSEAAADPPGSGSVAAAAGPEVSPGVPCMLTPRLFSCFSPRAATGSLFWGLRGSSAPYSP